MECLDDKTIQNKAIERQFQDCGSQFIVFYKVALTFQAVKEILK